MTVTVTVTVRRLASRLGAVLVSVTGLAVVVDSPAVAAPGFAVRIEAPGRFTAGAAPATLAAVVATDRADCRKVRWSLVVAVRGLRLDQVRVDRVEETGSFPVQIRADGDVARVTDTGLDPGTLCRDRTVTARYRVAFAAGADGRITLTTEAYDERLRLLADASVARPVAGAGAANPPGPPDGSTRSADPDPNRPAEQAEPPTPDPGEVTDPTDPGEVTEAPEEPAPEPTTGTPAVAGGAGGGTDGRTDPAGSAGPLGPVQVGFLIGALLLFLGVGLLMRVRHRLRGMEPTRRRPEPGQAGPW